jgi:hypothetical protein
MSETRTHLGDFGHLMRIVCAAEDFGLNRAEARVVAMQALEEHGSASESLDRVAAALAARVLEKARHSV